MAESSITQAAYGLGLVGLNASPYLDPLPEKLGWPLVEIREIVDARPGGPDLIDDAVADLGLLDGDRALIDRASTSATYISAQDRVDGRIVHPFLTALSTVFAWWLDREAFHGGAFIAGGGAWGVLGEREAGKSSLLAALSLTGRAVVSDDLLVIEDQAALPGPRCIDLRPGVGAALGVRSRTEVVRGGQRLRLAQVSIAAQIPMRGWIFPSWGPSVEMRRLSASERLGRLVAHSCLPGAGGRSFVDLVKLPAWQFQRPRDWDLLDDAVERLLVVTDA